MSPAVQRESYCEEIGYKPSKDCKKVKLPFNISNNDKKKDGEKKDGEKNDEKKESEKKNDKQFSRVAIATRLN